MIQKAVKLMRVKFYIQQENLKILTKIVPVRVLNIEKNS